MKKKLFLLFSVIFTGVLFSYENIKSDIAIYKDISQSFENCYYSGTIENVDFLQKQYPDSVFIQPALVYKANALVELGCYEDAIKTLNIAISHMHTGQKEFVRCYYLLGLSYFNLEKYDDAVENFYKANKLASINKLQEEKVYFDYSLFYSAESYYNSERFNKAYPIYEYVIEHGRDFSSDDYNQAVQKLMLSYNKLGLYKKTTDLFESFNIDDFHGDIKSILQLYAAEAYEKNKKYDKAYELYCNVITSENEELAIIALKDAYNLSETKKINVNPGNVFSQSAGNFKNNPELVNEFWVRLGIDEYNKKHYNKAESYFDNVSQPLAIINIYKAKIILDTDFSDAGGKKAEEILLRIKNLHDKKNNKIKGLSDTYYSLLLQSEVQQNKWDSVPSIYKNIKNPDFQSIYINSSYYYRRGEYEKVDQRSGVLYASALSCLGKYKQSCDVYKSLDFENKIGKEHLIEYAKALFLIEQYDAALEVAQRSDSPDKDYISGLCNYNLGKFAQARNCFISYIKDNSGKADFNKLALYYKGQSEYAIGEYKNAYTTFVRLSYLDDDKISPYTHKAHYYAALSALQLKDYNNAAVQGKNFIKTSSDNNERFNAVIFTSEILADSNRYNEAVELLQPYGERKSEFTVEALFRIAKIYEKQGNINLADETYSKIFKDYSQTEFAEEAMYRTAEVFYLREDFSTAYIKFNNYIEKYAGGKFLDCALYFSGDCALRVGDVNKSILINKNLIAKFPESVYVYGAYKNLLTGYYQLEEYSQAMEMASILVKDFKEQAAAENIGGKLLELEKIVKGTDRRVVEKQAEYEAAGGLKTKKGRKIGSEIVSLYSENSYTQKYAYELAVQLLEVQKDSDEIAYAAKNAEFAGDYLRTKQENKKSAEYYLLAAKYYRSTENSLKAAAVLYSAAEAFSGAGLNGDAKETADMLKKLYPETKYAQRVDKIVR